jgi:hypothetical protein
MTRANQVRMARDVAAMFDELRILAEKRSAVLADGVRPEEQVAARRYDRFGTVTVPADR